MKKQPKKTPITPAKNLEKVQIEEPKKNDFWSNSLLHKFIIFVVAVGLYANTLPNEYAIDDTIVITDNHYTRAGAKGIPGILTKDTFYGFFKTEKNLVSGGRYRPLSLVVFAIEEAIFGKKNAKDERSSLVYYADNQQVTLLDMKPIVGHCTNALFYGLLGLMIYITLFSLTNNRLITFISTLLFVVHPLHTEAVANIKGLDEILVLLGSLATLYFSLKDDLINKILAGVCFFLALLSKENAAMFLFIVPMSLYFFKNKSILDSLKSTLPLWLAFGIYFFIRMSILGGNKAEPIDDMMNNPFLKMVSGAYQPFTPSEKFATILYTLGLYVKLFFVPFPLTNDYYPRHIGIMTFTDWGVLLSLVLYAALVYFGVVLFRKRNGIGYGILFFLITLTIVSNIFFPIGTNMSERFMFMPSLGLCLAVGMGVNQYFKKYKTLIISVLCVVLITFSGLTFARNLDWKDDFTLLNQDLKVSKNSGKLLFSLAFNQFHKSEEATDTTEKANFLRAAEVNISKSLEIYPLSLNSYNLKGMVVFNLGRREEGIETLNKGIALFEKPDLLKKQRGQMYREMARLEGEKNKNIDKAIEFLQKALADNPDDVEALRLMGVAQGTKGNTEFVIQTMKKIIELEPKNSGAYQNLATAYYIKGDKKTGDSLMKKASTFDPNLKK